MHAALSCHFIQHYFVSSFTDLHALEKVEWSLALVAVLGMIIGWIVNSFFIWRIWLLSNRLWVVIVTGLLATTRAVIGIYVCCLAFPYRTWAEFTPHAYPYLLAGLVVEVLANSAIAIAVSYELSHGRSGIRQTDALINRLLIFTVNTGAMTSFIAIAEMVTFVLMSDTLVFLAFVFVQSKLYANCLLATLNARKSMRAQSVILSAPSNNRNNPDLALKGFKFPGPPRTAELRSTHPIEIQRQTVVETDGYPFHSPMQARPYPSYLFEEDSEKAPSLTMTV